MPKQCPLLLRLNDQVHQLLPGSFWSFVLRNILSPSSTRKAIYMHHAHAQKCFKKLNSAFMLHASKFPYILRNLCPLRKKWFIAN